MREPCGRPCMKVIERPMEPFNRTLAVRFMNNKLCEATGNANLSHSHQESRTPNMTVRSTKVEESSNGASTLS